MNTDRKVMIVEDSNTVRLEVKLLLKKIGVTLVEAANEIGMFNTMEEYGKCVDLILMDLTLKYENGFDLIKKIKSNEKYREIPIIVLTEHADVRNVLRAKELGVDGYLIKPIQKEELISRVTHYLSGS